MGRDRDPGVKRGGMAGLRRKKDGKAGFENPYCGPSYHVIEDSQSSESQLCNPSLPPVLNPFSSIRDSF